MGLIKKLSFSAPGTPGVTGGRKMRPSHGFLPTGLWSESTLCPFAHLANLLCQGRSTFSQIGNPIGRGAIFPPRLQKNACMSVSNNAFHAPMNERCTSRELQGFMVRKNHLNESRWIHTAHDGKVTYHDGNKCGEQCYHEQT